MIRSLKIKKSLLFILGLSVCLVPDNYSQSQNFNWEALENQIQEEVNNHLQNLQEKTLEEQRAILEAMDPKHIELMTKYIHPETVEGTLVEERIYNMNPDVEKLSDNNHASDPNNLYSDDTQFDIDNHYQLIQPFEGEKPVPWLGAPDLLRGYHPPNPDLKSQQQEFFYPEVTKFQIGGTYFGGVQGDSHFDINKDLEYPATSWFVIIRLPDRKSEFVPHPEERNFDDSFFPIEVE